MPVDDSEFLELCSPRQYKHVWLYIIGKASLILFDILPEAFLFLCDAWISLLMWFNNMDYVVPLRKILLPATSTGNVNDGDSSEVDQPNVIHGGGETLQPQDQVPIEQEPQPGEVEVAHDDPVDNDTPLALGAAPIEQSLRCDHCLSTTIEPPIIQCPANHIICLQCLTMHADVQLSKGDPELLCLHPIQCLLAFELEELQKLPQQALWDLFGRFRRPVGEPVDEPQHVGTITEMDEGDTNSVANTLIEDESSDEEDDGVMYAAFELAEAVSMRRISFRKPRRTRVKLEEAEDVTREETWPNFEEVPVKEQAFMPPPLTLHVLFPQNPSVTYSTHITAGWDSTIPANSVAAPPLLWEPSKAEKVDVARASSAKPSDAHISRKALHDALEETKRKRGNAQARLWSARKKVKEGKWPPERLEKAERDRAEAGMEQAKAQAALDAWDASH
ncbi:hypothetical protein FA13DRAFT_1739329 [Coprinellus micaceus]|uniref:Uncharacterized protein n=1 Tax=Coprinellus micaceus TaxID=71717 RepID=A0A4Y7SR03_COPMI|nr:hypothetical protein FA13DRAFT_1739329 [Coprinellus micaceus]